MFDDDLAKLLAEQIDASVMAELAGGCGSTAVSNSELTMEKLAKTLATLPRFGRLVLSRWIFDRLRVDYALHGGLSQFNLFRIEVRDDMPDDVAVFVMDGHAPRATVFFVKVPGSPYLQ